MKTLLLDLLQRYLRDRSSFEELQQLVARVTWDEVADRDALDLAWDLEARIAEFTGGHISETELRAALREAAEIAGSANAI